MDTILNLIKIWSKEAYGKDTEWNEAQISWLKDTMIDKAKTFLEWLIKNDHIEEIKSDKKSGPDINDYIKYIATTEDPMKTLSGLIK